MLKFIGELNFAQNHLFNVNFNASKNNANISLYQNEQSEW